MNRHFERGHLSVLWQHPDDGATLGSFNLHSVPLVVGITVNKKTVKGNVVVDRVDLEVVYNEISPAYYQMIEQQLGIDLANS